jgi:hypothetical protein
LAIEKHYWYSFNFIIISNNNSNPNYCRAYASFIAEDNDVPVLTDMLGENGTDIVPFIHQCQDLVKFYKTLDKLIPAEQLPANESDFIEQMEEGFIRQQACGEYFRGLEFELFSVK